MAKTKISEFNSNPALNTDIDSINIAENCPPSGINDAIRELMSQLKDWQSGTSNDPYVVGSSGSLTLNQGTANTVPYLNGSKVVTSGTALSFDGTNLGLGVTPSAWGGNYKAIQFSSGAISSYQTNAMDLYGNAYDSGAGAWKYLHSSIGATRLASTNGQFQFYNAPVGTAGNAITFTQAMTLDASGYLLVGATSSAGVGASRLQVGGSGVTSQLLVKSSGAHTALYVTASDVYQTWSSGGFLAWGNAPADGSTFTERARIDSSGNLLVNTTSAWSSTVRFQVKGASSAAVASFEQAGSSGDNIYIRNSNGVVGSITTSGSSTAYNTSSDYRLKNTIAPITGALAKVAQLKPVTYKWNADGSDGEGFIAHELAEICPQAVAGEKDAVDDNGNPVYQGIDVSFLVATLTAAIQEQQAIIESLKARLDAADL